MLGVLTPAVPEQIGRVGQTVVSTKREKSSLTAGPLPKSGFVCPWHQTRFNTGWVCNFGNRRCHSHELCATKAEFDAMAKPPSFPMEAVARRRSEQADQKVPDMPPGTEPKKVTEQFCGISYRTFCKEGVRCPGRLISMGGDGTCPIPIHLSEEELPNVEKVMRHNRAVLKVARQQ